MGGGGGDGISERKKDKQMGPLFGPSRCLKFFFNVYYKVSKGIGKGVEHEYKTEGTGCDWWRQQCKN